jgi:hypothetical protein
MPARGPGATFVAKATKEVTHGNPCVELNHAGIAHKSQQPPAMAPSTANAALARKIVVGESMVIHMDGEHYFPSSLLPGGAAVGDRLLIKKSDNSLVKAVEGAKEDEPVEAGTHVKFGVLDEIDTVAGLAHVNLTQRSSF